MNKPPYANAGKDQVIIFPIDSIKLDGRNSSDPDGKLISWQWIKISGPYSFKIRNEFAPSTVVANLDTGVYQFELRVTDNNGLYGRDTLQVIVNARFYSNRPPVANAGADQVITFPDNNVYLDGGASDDPDRNKLSYAWKKVSGPLSFNIAQPGEALTYVSNLDLGLYAFELKVTDEYGLFSQDTVNVNVVSCDNSIRPQVNARLIPVGTLSEARAGMAVATAGSKILFAGAALSEDRGSSGYGSSMVDIYDIVTQTWTSKRLSQRRSHIAAVSAGNKIFLAGGRLGDGAFDELFSIIDIYDASANSWSGAALSEERAFIAAATVGNKVFFAGGEKDMNYNTSNIVDIYDLESDNWSMAILSEPRAYISAVTIDNKVYFAGGHREDRWYSDPSSRIDIYDNATNSWSVSGLFRPMGNLGGIAVDGKIYWTQGCNVEIKDVNSWSSSIASLSQPAEWNIDEGSNPVEANGKIVFFRQWGDNTDKFDIYDIKTKTWSVGILPVKIHLASIISVNNVIYIAGGSIMNGGSSNFSNQVWKLEF